VFICSPTPLLEAVWLGLLCYYLSSVIPVLGVVVGHDSFQQPQHSLAKHTDLIASFAAWDGEHNLVIVTQGYSYDEHRPSNVAFLPADPLLGWLVVTATGMAPDLALLLVSHLILAATFVVLAAYARLRETPSTPQLTPWVLLAFGLFPTTFFWRIAYSESVFRLSLGLGEIEAGVQFILKRPYHPFPHQACPATWELVPAVRRQPDPGRAATFAPPTRHPLQRQQAPAPP
jgi:hypothetical protein